MSEIQKLKLKCIVPNSANPRINWDDEDPLRFGAELKENGQHYPALVRPISGDAYELVDGERRWRALKAIGAEEMLCLVLPNKLSETQLHILQNSIDAHRVGLNCMERSDLLQKIRSELKCSVNDLAEKLHMSQPLVSKLLSLQKLSPDIRQRARENRLGFEKAYLVSQEPDAARQEVLATQAANLDRQRLRKTVHRTVKTEGKVQSARFVIPGNVQLIITKPDLTMDGCVDALGKFHRILKKHMGEGWDIATTEKVMAQNAKPKEAPAAPQEKAQVQP